MMPTSASSGSGPPPGYDPAELRGVVLSGEDRLAKWLKVNKTFLDVAGRPGVFDFLGEAEKDVFGRLGLALCYPVLSMNRLIGILGIGPKGARGSYSADESAFIDSLMPQAGIALENALLYKEQKERFRRMLRADRLATIGELAAGAAHEIRNPLTSIRSSLQYLESAAARITKRSSSASPCARRTGSTRSCRPSCPSPGLRRSARSPAISSP
ncbi:MAG: hypothetical protein MZV63_65130 [Marinilabiliales bacterium]|nr:hypothetical protein [Marinilabiliales bacterium]